MIQKTIFQKRINQPTKKKIKIQQNQNISPIKKPIFKDISNQLKTPQNSLHLIDYKVLYELQIQKSQEYLMKITLLEQKIKHLEELNSQLKNKLKYEEQKQQQNQEQNQNQTSLKFIPIKKKSHKQIFFEQIRSFKSNLPNSIKIIQFQQLDDFQSINLITDQEIMTKKSIHTDKNLNIRVSGPQRENQKGNREITFYEEEQIENLNNRFLNLNTQQKSFIASSVATLKLINDQSLIDCMALYGLSEEYKFDQELEEDVYEGELLHCSKKPHQIINHSTKLVFPEKINKQEIKVLSGEQAIEAAVGLLGNNLKSEDFKAFTLMFQPATIPNEQFGDDLESLFDGQKAKKEEQVIEIVNKERRFYAICLPYYDFDIIKSKVTGQFADLSFQNSLQQDIFKQDIKQIQQEMQQPKRSPKLTLSNSPSKISQKNKSLVNDNPIQSMQQETFNIRISKKILTFFTKYPFLPFFQALLNYLLKQSFEQRKQQMKKNLTKLNNFHHQKTIQFIKLKFSQMNKTYQLNKKFTGKINQIFQLKLMSKILGRYQNISLQLSKSLLKGFYSQMWAFPLLRLFTLDTFLDTITLMLLQEKMIFVCQNQHILTNMIFLFTKVLIRPFNYPYPVVSMIPNQFDYFNAPFPIVYGCVNNKMELMRQKIPKIYKNVYVFITANGVQIYSYRNLTKNLACKSPKLRDKLLSSFIKIDQHKKQVNSQKSKNSSINFLNLTSFLGFNNNPTISQTSQKYHSSPLNFLQKQKYLFSQNNRQLAHQVIQKVYFYLSSIKQKLPSRKQVNEIKQKIQVQIRENKSHVNGFRDVDKETYEKIKDSLLKKTTDPFVQRFLNTQIVGMEILK